MPDQNGWTLVQPASAPAAAPGWKLVEPAPKGATAHATEASGKPLMQSAGDFLGEATQGVNPANIFHAVKSLVLDLGGTAKGMVGANDAVRAKAVEAFKRGDNAEGIRHGLTWLLPVIGGTVGAVGGPPGMAAGFGLGMGLSPRADEAGDYLQQGQIAKGLGASVDLGAQVAIGAKAASAAGKIAAKVPPMLRSRLNPVEASAVRFGEAEGIPIDAGTKTGSTFVKNAQKKVSGTFAGSGTAEKFQAAQADALTATGNRLATEAGPKAATPVSAGEGVQGALKARIEQAHTTANGHYDVIRKVEADPARAASMQVDVTPTKAALKPTYDRLLRESELVPLQGGKARALNALDRLINGPDAAPLSELDSALGDLKAMSRGADMPELRTGGQAVAAQAVKVLDARVRAAAANAGPDVLKALEDGRAATIDKYRVADVQDLLSGEPGQVFKQLTANKDTALNRLRAVQGVAPKEMPNVARAFLEDAMDTATGEGGFGHADKLYANWQKLGTDTKRTLFPKEGQVQALDDFFLLAKKIGQNPNPSGTANVSAALNVTQVLAAVPAWGLAKMLYTPTGVRLLTRGMRLSVNASPAARSLALAQVVRAAQSAGVPLPAAAGVETPETNTP